MSSLIKTAADLARAYPRLTSAAKLADYTASRLPNNLKSIGPLSKMASGSGRIPFSLGDELVVKTARMPRGMMENSMEGDWVAPVPEAVWKSDDDAIAVVKRLTPMTAKQHPEAWKQISELQKAVGYQKNPQYDANVQAALEELGWQDLLNYDPLWGDVVKRNVGMEGAKPMLLDAGILNRNILNPAEVSDTISPAEWAQYRREVLRAKSNFAQGGQVKPAYNAQNPMDHGQRRAPTQERIRQATSDWDAMKKGARNWAPDVAGFFLGDIPDALTYVARRAANVQGEQSVPSLGAGNAVRRAVHDLQAQLGLEDKFVPPSGQVVGPVYEPSGLEQTTQFLNPLAFVNPVSATKTAGRGAAEVIARAAQSEGPLARMATAGFRPMNVVKQKGGNFLSGWVEDELGWLKNADIVYPEGHPGKAMSEATNNWIDKALTKYVKNQMATPEDPIRALAEQGVLHFEPGDVSRKVSTAASHRVSAGMPIEPTGQSELARKWDTIADYNTIPVKAGALPIKNYPKDLHWLQKASPETMTYQPMDSTLANSTGFDHLIDELSNSINPESGLPRHLLFPADRLDKVSVPQAVQRVSDINKWRAEQKVLADQARANNAATVLYKEYPEKGMRWVQLKGEKEALADALNYEHDIMGHCVDTYCDNVASGRSNIFSLRDSKGQPHVTIEVEPNEKPYAVSGEAFARLSPAEQAQYREYVMQWRRRNPEVEELTVEHAEQALREAGVQPAPPRIVQIKGKGNAKPHDDYLPYVQDFVKSGQWSHVGELDNAGLVKGNIGGYMTPEEALAVARYKLDPEDPRSLGLSHEVSLNDAANLYYPDDADRQNFIRGALTNPENFAQGGSVAPNKIETLGQLRAIMATLHKDSAHA